MAKTFSSKEISEGVITDQSLRETLAAHTEVLDRAGKLLTMPKVNMATTEQVAEFFGVPVKTVYKVYDRNKNELNADGIKWFKVSESASTECRIRNNGRAGVIICAPDGDISVPNAGLRLFPKRAVLRIAMLLTGSEVARAVRTALLNLTEKVEEKAPDLVEEMVQEQGDVMKAVAMAFTSGDVQKTTEAFLKITAWQSGKINEARAAITELKSANQELSKANEALGTVNRMLIGEQLPFSPRDSLIRIVRACNRAAGRTAEYVGAAYNEFYDLLASYEHIHVMKRRIGGVTGRKNGKPEALISLIKDEEWPRVMRVAALFAHRYCVDPWEATNAETVEKFGLESVAYNGRTYNAFRTRTYRQ